MASSKSYRQSYRIGNFFSTTEYPRLSKNSCKSINFGNFGQKIFAWRVPRWSPPVLDVVGFKNCRVCVHNYFVIRPLGKRYLGFIHYVNGI
jgi:hypothetical protein